MLPDSSDLRPIRPKSSPMGVITFDPKGAHKQYLPPLVQGVEVDGYLGWDHDECGFFITRAGLTIPVEPGDKLVYDDFDQVWVMDEERFNEKYEFAD